MLAQMLFEIVTQPALLIDGKLTFVNQEDLVARHLQQQLIVQTIKLLIGFQYPCLNPAQQVAGVRGHALFFANDNPPLELRETDLIELVEVVGVNPQKTHTLNQRIAFVCRFLEDALVE